MSDILMPNITITNTIKIPRDINKEITAYNIYVEETMKDGTQKQYLFKTIQNPVSPNPIKETLQYKMTYDGEIQLRYDFYYSVDNPITIYSMDKIELDISFYNYDEQNNILNIDTNNGIINADEYFYISAYYDELVVTHTTSNKCTYSVVPVFNTTEYGKHYLLK